MILNLFTPRSDHPLADPRELRRIIGELPPDKPAKVVDEIVGWFESLRLADDLRVDHLFDIVRQLDDALQPQLRRLGRDYLLAPRLSKAEERRLWNLCFSCWEWAALLYADCLARMAAQPRDKGSEALKAQLPLLAARRAGALVAQMRWLEYRYGPLRETLWQQLGEVYLAAEAGGFAQKPLQLYPGLSALTSVTQQYLQAIVLRASSMDKLTPLEIELADRLIAHFLPAFVFSATVRPDSVYWIDAASALPPARLARHPSAVTGTLRFFSPGSAPQQLVEVLHQVERGDVPADLNLGGQYSARQLLPVLRHLATYWAPQPPMRAHARHAVKTRIAVLHGFDDCSAVFSGDAAQAGREQDARSWVAENVSLGGFGATLDDADAEWLKVGCLVAIQPDGGDNWVLGIVRRFVRGPAGHVSVGIQSLAHQARGIELRPRVSGFSAALGAPGIWLGEPAGGGGEAAPVRIVLPIGGFDVRENLEFHLDGQNHLLAPVELEESGGDFEIARFRRL